MTARCPKCGLRGDLARDPDVAGRRRRGVPADVDHCARCGWDLSPQPEHHEPTLWESDPVPEPEDHAAPDPRYRLDNLRRDLPAGRAARDAGQQQALERDDIAVWREEFRLAVYRMATASPTPFTSEDVLETVGLPRGEIGQHRNNAVGALMAGMARKGVIRRFGYTQSTRPSSHAAVLSQWVGAVWDR